MGDVVDMEAFKRTNQGSKSVRDYLDQLAQYRVRSPRAVIKTVKRCAVTQGVQELGMKWYDNEYDFLGALNEKFVLFNDGDWGDICDEDKQHNEQAVKDGNQVLGVYRFNPKADKFYLILDAGHETLTALLPSEY